MRPATEQEYCRAQAKANQPPRYINGKRFSEVHWHDLGTEVAAKYDSLMRGKVANTSYMVNPDYL